MAIVAIAILTALAVDLAYETQVRLRIAANARDDLRAEALAHSAVSVSRLVLSFQNQIDQAMAAASPPQASSGSSGGVNPTAALPRPQIWNLIPVSSALTQTLFGGGASGKTPPPAADGKGKDERSTDAVPSLSYGDFEGGFQARIEDEGQKINAQLDALGTSDFLGAQVEALLRMVCDGKWDPLFDRTDADGQRYSRADLIIHLRDWVTDSNAASALKVSFPGGNCSFLVPPNPFEQGFSDKNFAYDRGPDRYKSKNARLDSVEELNLVAGVSDAFMAAFGDELTVYLSKNTGGMNVNTDDKRQQLLLAWLVADDNSKIRITDPKFVEALPKALSEARMGGFVSITPAQFIQIVQSLGVTTRTDLAATGAKSPFTDRSVVFQIHALGVANDVTHDTDVVVTFDQGQNAQGQNAQGQNTQGTQNMQQQIQQQLQAQQTLGAATGQLNMGQIIHWRED